jgi:hypothetical protein
MLAVLGTYENGTIRMDEQVEMHSPVRVVVTFLENATQTPKKPLSLDDFSFAKSRELLKHVKTSLSDEIIRERRQD